MLTSYTFEAQETSTPSKLTAIGEGRTFGALPIALFCAWFGFVYVAASRGLFGAQSPFPLSWLQTSIMTPMAAFWVIFSLHDGFRSFIRSLDFLFLTAMQSFRILGLSILVMWGYGLVPGGFAIPMSLLDASVGLLAVYVVVAVSRRKTNWKRAAIILHGWGFLDFLVTILLALFAWKALGFDPAIAKDGYVSLLEPPLSLFPSFAIPFFSCLHFAAWVKLADMSRSNP